MDRKLQENMQDWIDKLMDVQFKGRDILLQQLSKSETLITQEYDYISIKFSFSEETNLYPYRTRVPVEMNAYQKRGAPVVFLLHVIDGLIDELEIFTADSEKIDAGSIYLDNIEHVIDKEVMPDQKVL